MKICFLDFSTKLGSINDLVVKPRGGMINSLFEVPDYLAKRGHDVWVLSDIKEQGCTRAGVKWINQYSYQDFDFLVINRGAGYGYNDIKAKHRILWTHDLPHSGFIPDPQIMKAFKATVFMSRYAEKVWRTFYKTIGKSFLIPNGVDKEFYPREKDLNKIIYFCHPNRGLKRLNLIIDCINNRLGREIRLDAYSGGGMYPRESEMPAYGETWELDYQQTGNLYLHEPIPKHELVEEVGKAGLFIMPTNFPEICSNSVLQALKSGTPVVSTGGIGATPEWVKHKKNGMLTTYTPNDYMVHSVEIIRHSLYILENEKRHRKMIQNAAKTKIHSWSEIGEKWERMLKRLYWSI